MFSVFSYGDELSKNGNFTSGEALQPANTAVTVHWRNGKVAVTDGPYAETKELLGGILVLEAREISTTPSNSSPSIRSEDWTIRDTSSGGPERYDRGERAAALCKKRNLTRP
jgi:hypothetical protein